MFPNCHNEVKLFQVLLLKNVAKDRAEDNLKT